MTGKNGKFKARIISTAASRQGSSLTLRMTELMHSGISPKNFISRYFPVHLRTKLPMNPKFKDSLNFVSKLTLKRSVNAAQVGGQLHACPRLRARPGIGVPR
jgi:hypothetical protein